MASYLKSWLLFALCLLSHLPFLNQGYGKEFDAWSNVLNARNIWQSGQYEVSRLPGHPLYEALLTALWPLHSPWFYNLLSALVTAAAVVVLYRVARLWQWPHAFGLALGFAGVPVFFLAGTYTIDYNFALFFLLAAFYQGLRGRWLSAGLLIGLATGFRISSLALLLPYSLALGRQMSFRQHLRFWLGAGITALLCYLPALLVYGFSFLDFHKPPFPGWANVLYKISLGIWGLPLLLGLLVLGAAFAGRRLRPQYAFGSLRGPAFWGLTLGILVLQALVFARLPFKAEFFIPALPFLWLGLFSLLTKRKAWVLSGLAWLSLSSFGFDYLSPWRGAHPSPAALTFPAGGKEIFLDPLQGPALLDRGKRQQKSALVLQTQNKLATQADSVWLVAGWYWPELQFRFPANGPHHYDHYSSQKELDSARALGYRIYYLPEMEQQNQLMGGPYLADSMAQALLPQ